MKISLKYANLNEHLLIFLTIKGDYYRMMWKIVADSGSNLREVEDLPENISLGLVPLVLHLDEIELIDTPDIDTKKLVKDMGKAKETSTACPAPGVYAEAFEGAENVLCITISSEVSGSFNSAVLGRELALEKNPVANIYVFDSKSAGGEIDLLILKAIELIKEGNEFQEVLDDLHAYHEHTYVGYMLQSIKNLVKSGRVSKVVGSIVGLLNINILGIRSEEGTIEMSDRVRGEKRALKKFLSDMIENGFNGNAVEISHVNNRELAEQLAESMLKQFPDAQITIRPTSGLASFYAEDNGLIVGYERD